MKKVLVVLLVCVILANMFAFGVSAEESINVLVDGGPVSFDVAPYAENGRVMVPVRAIFESLGADVSWNEESQEVIATKGINKVLLFTGDSNRFCKNDIIYSLDAPVAVKEGRTFVPLRAVSEAFDCEVSWDNQTNTVSIDSAKEFPMEVSYVEATEERCTDNPDVTVTYNFLYPQIVDGKDFADERLVKSINEISKSMTYEIFDYVTYAYRFWENWQYVAYLFPGYPNVTIDIKTELHVSEKYNTISLVARASDPYIGLDVESRTFDAKTGMEYVNVATAVGSRTLDEDDALRARMFEQFKADFNGDANHDEIRFSTFGFEDGTCEWWISGDRLYAAEIETFLTGVGKVQRYLSTSIVP